MPPSVSRSRRESEPAEVGQLDHGWAEMASTTLARTFDPVRVVADALDDPVAGPVTALGAKVPQNPP
jgi:hypothetical protein